MPHFSPLPPDHRIIHQRAAEALLDLLDEQPGLLPTLDQISERLGMPADELKAIYSDSSELIAVLIENAVSTLVDICVKSVVLVDPDKPIEQFNALGRAYLEWALAQPRLFRLITDRRYVDIPNTPALMRHVLAMTDLMQRMLIRAKAQRQLPQDADIDLIILSGRSFVYGLASMAVDGRLTEIYTNGSPPPDAVMNAMDAYIHLHMQLIASGAAIYPSRSDA